MGEINLILISMIHHKKTNRKNEWVTINSTIDKETDTFTLDFGYCEKDDDEATRPSIWVSDKDDVALFVIKNEKQIDDFIKAFRMLKRFYTRTRNPRKEINR